MEGNPASPAPLSTNQGKPHEEIAAWRHSIVNNLQNNTMLTQKGHTVAFIVSKAVNVSLNVLVGYLCVASKNA